MKKRSQLRPYVLFWCVFMKISSYFSPYLNTRKIFKAHFKIILHLFLHVACSCRVTCKHTQTQNQTYIQSYIQWRPVKNQLKLVSVHHLCLTSVKCANQKIYIVYQRRRRRGDPYWYSNVLIDRVCQWLVTLSYWREREWEKEKEGESKSIST